MRIVDLTAVLRDGFVVYPGDPDVRITSKTDHEADGYNVLSLALGSHSGTHVDLPRHHIEDGPGADKFALDVFMGDALVVSVPVRPGEAIEAQHLRAADIRRGDIVLIHSGWETRSGTAAFFESFPYLGMSAADLLTERGVKAVGCDMPSVDGAGLNADVHHHLLGAGVGIIEALVNLEGLAGRRVRFIGLPLSIENGDGSPVRAVALLD